MALLSPERTYPNMFDAHPPFQIDGNFGGAAGILEMLVQSGEDLVHLLPALPSAWPDGSLLGARARGGLEVDLTWRKGRLTAARITSGARKTVTVRYRGSSLSAQVEPRQLWAYPVGQDAEVLVCGSARYCRPIDNWASAQIDLAARLGNPHPYPNEPVG